MNRSDWFSKAGFGLFVHWTTASLPEKGEKKPHEKAIEDFDLDGFVSQVEKSGAKFVFFTVTHSEMFVPFPLPELDEIVPGHTSRRDLISEMYDKLDERGIKLLFYFNGDGSEDKAWQSVTQFETDPYKHAEYVYRVTEAISKKYGKKVSGWWIDCCYEPPHYRNTGARYDFKRYADILRSGNPDSLVTFNFRGEMDWKSETGRGICDYQAGEENDLLRLPESRFSGEGQTQWFGLCHMCDQRWVHDRNGEPKATYDNETVLNYINNVRAKGGVFAYNVGPYQEGLIPKENAEQLAWLGERIK